MEWGVGGDGEAEDCFSHLFLVRRGLNSSVRDIEI